jgi:DNA-directed RNA polymerase subunit RPC12/RpoP
MNWHYVKDNKQTGPVDHTELEALFRAGTINNNTLVWSPGMETWLPYSEARAEKPPATTGNEAVCAECGKTFDKGEMIRHGEAWVCAACKSVFLQKLSEGVEPVTGAMRYAGFWIRFVAKFLDGIIMSVLVLVPMIAIMASMGTFERSSEEPSQAEMTKWHARSRWWTEPAQRLDTDVPRGGSSRNSLAASFVTSAISWLLLTRKSAPSMTESATLG